MWQESGRKRARPPGDRPGQEGEPGARPAVKCAELQITCPCPHSKRPIVSPGRLKSGSRCSGAHGAKGSRSAPLVAAAWHLQILSFLAARTLALDQNRGLGYPTRRKQRFPGPFGQGPETGAAPHGMAESSRFPCLLCEVHELFLVGSPLGFPRIARCGSYRLTHTAHQVIRQVVPGYEARRAG